jgi:hypothetical protein
MKFKVGDKVRVILMDEVGTIAEIDTSNIPYLVKLDDGGDVWRSGKELELVQEPKKVLNFWEAREAALAGKKVRRGITDTIFTARDFIDDTFEWDNHDIKADWEIVEEENEIVTYHQVFSDGTVGSGSYPRMDHTGEKVRIAMIELTTDKNGKLLNARNVETTKV